MSVETQGAGPGRTRYETLDGLRGVAALAVVLLHVTVYFRLPFRLPEAHLAVDFFFMLSGFVLADAYGERLKAGWPVLSFLKKRIIRLYPMILAGGLIGLCVLVLRRLTVGDVSWRGVALVAVSNILLLPSNALIGFRSYSFLLNSPFWSLSWEMVVGLIYAILARGLTFARLLTILAAGALAVVLLSLRKGGLDTGFYWTDFDLGFVRAVFPFFAGVALRQGLRLHPTRKALDLPTLGLLALALLTPVALSPALEFLAVLVLFPGIAIMGASAEASPRLGRLWARMGDLSYPLYAVHYPIIVVVAQVAKHLHGAKLYLAGLATTLAVIALAQLLLMLYDRPLRAWLNRMRRPSGPRPSAPLKATAAPRG